MIKSLSIISRIFNNSIIIIINQLLVSMYANFTLLFLILNSINIISTCSNWSLLFIHNVLIINLLLNLLLLIDQVSVQILFIISSGRTLVLFHIHFTTRYRTNFVLSSNRSLLLINIFLIYYYKLFWILELSSIKFW